MIMEHCHELSIADSVSADYAPPDPPWRYSGFIYKYVQIDSLVFDLASYHINCVLRNDDHVLHELLSKRVDIAYNLPTRCHDRAIPRRRVDI